MSYNSNDSNKISNSSNYGSPTLNRMMNYINDKYPEDNFTFNRSISGDLGSSDRNIYVKSEKFPNYNISLLLTKVDGVEVINDNYLYFKFKEQTQQLIKEILSEILGVDYKFFYGIPPSVGVKSFPGDLQFEDYISDTLSLIDFSVVVSPEYRLGDQAAFEETLKKAFGKRNIRIFSMDIYFDDDSGGYSELDDAGLFNYINRHRSIQRFSALSIGSENVEFTWR